ncbi:hypothetical protein [Bradymonas sediminis]|uniref:Uncharacterized protein n=1 Tax=Bradymonas sediminis TaxID=1548548 RepID=A0A2Z4FJG3_9DELT|nr:hypothetical protein [Bradymonas sediminis]AWV88836.1 hypothetical protein DN745_05580 [Bradymonas sediminis]TDP71838.1 hypothetical protein DFR33_10852 [Bradymonas sediminis]
MNREELVKLAGEKLASSIFRDAPTEVAGLETRAFGEMTSEDVRVFFYEDVLDELIFAATYRDEPSFALLLGAFAVDKTGPFMEVTGFSSFQQLAELDALYRELKPEMDELIGDFNAARQPLEHVVGLFVGAPGSEGKLLPEIARVHLSLFNVPYQVAAVIDPENGCLGLHARPPSSAFFNLPFWTVRHREDSEPE